MNNETSWFLLAALALACGGSNDKPAEGPAERAGEKIDKAGDDVERKADEAGEKIDDAADKTNDKIEKERKEE